MTDELNIALNYKDEWPARIAEFIVNLSEWYAAHPSLVDKSAIEITRHLVSVFDEQFPAHTIEIFSDKVDAAGNTFYLMSTSVNFDDLRRAIATAAFERYALLDFMLKQD